MVFVLSCAIIFGCTAFFRPKLVVFAESNWQSEENVDTTSWYDGLTYEDVTVYSISTAEQLAGLATLVNSGVSFEGKTIKLKDTITLGTFVERLTEEDDYVLETGFEWVPIGTVENPFKGTFDAQNNVIKGVYINNTNDYVGLFGVVEGTIKNINIVDSYISGGNFVGSIAGSLKGTIDYCYSSATVVAGANSKKVGGLLGCAEGTVEKQTVITNSYTTNNLSLVVNKDLAEGDTAMIGGVVGCAKQNVLIENCYNRAVVKASSSYIGGVVGFATDNVEISRSYNDGEVVVENKTNKVEQYIGGVVGATVNECSIANSYNTGKVTTNSAAVGGVVGLAVSTTIDNSYNSGAVSGLSYVGGVAGAVKELSTVSDSHNQGAIIAVYVEGIVGENFAGVIAYNNNSEVKYCYNSGEVVYFVEPVAAEVEPVGEEPLPEEEVETPVVVETKNVAGVIAKNEKGSIYAVYNTGIVGDKNATNVAGIVAVNNAGKLTTSINTGVIYAKDIVAGVVVNNLNEATVKNCLSNAEIIVETEEATVAGLVVVNDEKSFVFDSYFNLELIPNSEAVAQNLAVETNVKNALGYNKSNMSNIKVELSDGSSCVGIIESFNQVAKKDTDSKWVASIDTNNGSSNIIFNVATENSFSITEVLAIILGAIAVVILAIYVSVYVKETRAKAAIPEFDGYGKDDIEDLEDNM